jgi:hypothetical protein
MKIASCDVAARVQLENDRKEISHLYDTSQVLLPLWFAPCLNLFPKKLIRLQINFACQTPFSNL